MFRAANAHRQRLGYEQFGMHGDKAAVGAAFQDIEDWFESTTATPNGTKRKVDLANAITGSWGTDLLASLVHGYIQVRYG